MAIEEVNNRLNKLLLIHPKFMRVNLEQHNMRLNMFNNRKLLRELIRLFQKLRKEKNLL